MKKTGTTHGIALVLLLVVVLPLLVYSVYQFSGLSAREAMVAEIYRRELDVVLFSINQFTWDVVNGWAGAIVTLLSWPPGEERSHAGGIAQFLDKNRAIGAVFTADSTGRTIRFIGTREGDEPLKAEDCAAMLEGQRALIERLLSLSHQDYRKIEPVLPPGTPGGRGTVALLFVMRDPAGTPTLAALILNEERFVDGILGERLREAAGGDFVVAVSRRSTGQQVFSTGEVRTDELKERRQVWLFPDLEVGIRLKGATLEDIARSRVARDLAILVVLDLVLVAGIWFVYRSIRREMELVRLKSDFVSNVSHELRTPLALIRMYAETLEMGRVKSEKKRQDYYDTIVRESERLSRLVNNLLNFSRMEAGRRPYVVANVDVNRIVTGVLDSFGPHLRMEGFVPVVTLDPSMPAIMADAEAVQEALINILDNALKYSEAEKFLRVATAVCGGEVVLEVEDHGIGIAPAHQKRIFETFYRVSGGLVHTAKGSGLGLSIAKHIMDAHGGRIEVRSVPGEGSTFVLIFPGQTSR